MASKEFISKYGTENDLHKDQKIDEMSSYKNKTNFKMKILNIITQIIKTKRNIYKEWLIKIEAMKIARKYDFNYWDGKRRYGYGGYKYIEGYWTPVAKKLIKKFSLTNKSSILDIGCGKGFTL